MDRFEVLATEYFDGDLDPQAAAELAAILREDPKKKRFFLELYQQNRLLEIDLAPDSVYRDSVRIGYTAAA